MTLRELTEDFQRLLELAETEDIDEEALRDTFEGLSGEFSAKADGYAEVINQLKNDAEMLENEIDRLNARRISIENNIERLKTTLKWAMETTGNVKFKTDFHSFGIRQNGGKKPLKITADVPEEFTKTEVKPDTEKIREYLEGGGTCDWAHIEERGNYLSIS